MEVKKPPSNDPDSVRQWVKKKLQALARLLRKLGASLPAILGSIVSWVLNMLKKGVLFMAEHTYAFITFIAGLVGYWIYEQITKKR